MTAQEDATKEGIKRLYAQESGIDVADSEFWAKLSEWKANQPDPLAREPDICPCCGQEIY